MGRREEGSTSPRTHTAAAGTSYFFFVSKDPPLQSVLFGVPRACGSRGGGGGTTRPRQMFRDAWVPFASAYYVLGICTYVRRATRDRFPMTCHAPVILDPRRDDDVDDGRARALQRNDDPRCTMSREGDWS